MKKPLIAAILIAALALAVCGKKAEASTFPTDEVPPVAVQNYEAYPGVNTAVRKTIDDERAYALQFWKKESTPEVEYSELPPKRFLDCERESISVNAWLFSQHASKDRKKNLNEKNRGSGIFYTCDNWSLGFDRMINSNRGEARVLSLLWGKRLIEVGPTFLEGKIGVGRLWYEVPRFDTTLTKNSIIGFASVGLVAHPRWTLNVAPVPETAGNAYIVWLTYRVFEFNK
jgi:hypothetical protein